MKKYRLKCSVFWILLIFAAFLLPPVGGWALAGAEGFSRAGAIPETGKGGAEASTLGKSSQRIRITKTEALDRPMLELVKDKTAWKKVRSVVYSFQGNGTDRKAIVTEREKINRAIRAIGDLLVLKGEGEVWTDYYISYGFLDRKGKTIASVSFDGPSIVRNLGGRWMSFQCVEGKTKMPCFNEISRDGRKSPKGTIYQPRLPRP
jgi:hypothetical protein